MKFVHTFWSKPLLNNKFEQRINSIRYTLTDYACSVAWIHRCGYEIVLYTDDYGAELLDFIPYDEVVIIDTNDIDSSMHFAAKFKFEALKDMDLGDVLIDGDLIIRSRKTCQLIENDTSDAVYSFIEPHIYTVQGGMKIPYYQKLINKMSCINYDSPYELPPITNLEWPNTSMLRINNQELKDEYLRQYEYHLNKLKDIDFEETWPDIFIEQYFLGCLLKNKNYKHHPFIEGYPSEESNNKALELRFTHLGTCKMSHNHVVEQWLKDANRNVYVNTIKEIEKQIKNII